MTHYDYIIAGAGCAGLSFLVRLLQTERFSDKKILLIDRQPKTSNDRTWCFWEKETGYFDEVVYKRWQQLRFAHPNYTTQYEIFPYTYKMIRAIDFYQHCFSIVHRYPNVDIRYEPVMSIGNNLSGACVTTDTTTYQATQVFNSIQLQPPVLAKNQYFLLQHFKGWFIETPTPSFDPACATLMDFRVDQSPGTSFVYVMPFTPTTALVEYTVFSPSVLSQPAYDAGLKDYLQNIINIGNYKICEEETGAIPMTNYRFPRNDGAITWLGTAGGQTKSSSGYTFQFIQKQADQLVQALLQQQPLSHRQTFSDKRFGWYDAILLNILSHNTLPGDVIFKDLFLNNKITDILQFLDNETSVLQEMKIVWGLPKKVFLRAAWQQLL
ncbi:lycopene cyclase family protein [Paraflavitalea pollutisoli]|uniref:lycopene cyclase family protein n=1 Tax=Paraflavitalea pollutisoli TaxID=3034143 RepID=UPI0023EBB81F|nr:lycopene cyclase family protein [Paraflavitalea sp. H1-2-19X]